MGAGAPDRRLVEVHDLDDAQVVERADQREHDGDDRQPDHAALKSVAQQRLQDDKLGVEPDRRRYAGKREHQQQHHERVPRAAAVQALQIGNLLGLEPLAESSRIMPKVPSVVSA